ncbi:MAG: hypothetical protein QOH53_1617 [Ilumatobacteraceae bacterium]|jgi:hypothetical protein
MVLSFLQAREAAETAGHMGGGGGDHHSNTDPAHEASESPERAAQAAANDAAIPAAPTSLVKLMLNDTATHIEILQFIHAYAG